MNDYPFDEQKKEMKKKFNERIELITKDDKLSKVSLDKMMDLFNEYIKYFPFCNSETEIFYFDEDLDIDKEIEKIAIEIVKGFETTELYGDTQLTEEIARLKYNKPKKSKKSKRSKKSKKSKRKSKKSKRSKKKNYSKKRYKKLKKIK